MSLLPTRIMTALNTIRRVQLIILAVVVNLCFVKSIFNKKPKIVIFLHINAKIYKYKIRLMLLSV